MTTELVLILGLYAFILLGVFLGESGPISTFDKAAPRLGARIERNLSTGFRFVKDGERRPQWKEPGQ